MSVLTLSDMTYDFDQFVSQLSEYAVTQSAWKGTLDIQTSKTLIDFAAAVGTYLQMQVMRNVQDCFSETAQSDEAIRANIGFQGVRTSRKLPAAIRVILNSAVDVFIPAFSQASIGGLWFNREVIQIPAGVPTEATLFQGEIKALTTSGLGTDFQVLETPETDFVVSDMDVVVMINNVAIPQARNAALWNFRNQPGYADLTDRIGRAQAVFGRVASTTPDLSDSSRFAYGSVPGVNDTVTMIYAVTDGAASNTLSLTGSRVSFAGFPTVSGSAISNPTGGSNERPASDYKYVIAGAFGDYNSSTTGNQYKTAVLDYPGIVDAITQAQRDINPGSKEWMNVIRVSALTSSPWTQAQKDDFIKYMQKVTMYAPRFFWQDPIPIPRDINIDVYVSNTASPTQIRKDVTDAITAWFSPRRGLLGTDFYESDIVAVVKEACKGQFAYSVDNSSYPMLVGSPHAANATATVLPGQGTLTQRQYAYSFAVTNTNGDVGTPDAWVFPQVTSNGSAIQFTWPLIKNAASIRVYGRKNTELGLITTLPGTATTWTDDGSLTPDPGGLPQTANEWPIRYNSLNSLTLRVLPSTRLPSLSHGT